MTALVAEVTGRSDELTALHDELTATRDDFTAPHAHFTSPDAEVIATDYDLTATNLHAIPTPVDATALNQPGTFPFLLSEAHMQTTQGSTLQSLRSVPAFLDTSAEALAAVVKTGARPLAAAIGALSGVRIRSTGSNLATRGATRKQPTLREAG